MGLVIVFLLKYTDTSRSVIILESRFISPELQAQLLTQRITMEFLQLHFLAQLDPKQLGMHLQAILIIVRFMLMRPQTSPIYLLRRGFLTSLMMYACPPCFSLC